MSDSATNTAGMRQTERAISSLVHRPSSWLEPLPLGEVFSEQQPLEVELGAGDGSFLARWAADNPHRNFIGVERLLGRLRKLDRKAQRLGLTNLRLLRIEAGYFINYLLPAASVNVVHVYFPDPWPKRRHRQHRLVNPPFAKAVTRVLAPGGLVYLRTDDADYFAQMQTVFEAEAGFRPEETPNDLRAVLTDFERGFNERGVATLRAAYRLR